MIAQFLYFGQRALNDILNQIVGIGLFGDPRRDEAAQRLARLTPRARVQHLDG